MMKTSGYDLVLLVNEKFLSQISGALLYNGFFTFNGSADLSLKLKPAQLAKIPAELLHFLKIGYRFKLNYEPHIDFQSDNKLGISFDVRTYLWFWDGLEIKFDLACSVVVPIETDEPNNKFCVRFEKCEVKELKLKTQYSLDESITLVVNPLVEQAVHAYFQKKENHFAIELPTIETYLPYTDKVERNKFHIKLEALKVVSSNSMVAAFNFESYDRGSINSLNDFARNASVGVAISEYAMNKVFDFFWEHTNWDKSYLKKDTFHINLVDDVLGVLTDITSFITNTGLTFASLGFLNTNIRYLGSDFIYTIDVHFRNKPTFDILAGNKVAIHNLAFDLFVGLKMTVTLEGEVNLDTSGPIPDECTPWEDDINISKKRKTTTVFDIGVPIQRIFIRSCTGRIRLNEAENTLEIKVVDFDFRLSDFVPANCIFLTLPALIIDLIVLLFKQKIIDAIPPYVVSPKLNFDIAPLLDKIDPMVVTPGLTIDPLDIPWKVNVDLKKLDITETEAVMAADVYFKELNEVVFPVPKYVVNVNNNEIHKAGCDSIMDTYEEHQRGYYLLEQALRKNYDGCKKCLPAFHNK
jgi:hypothetical protein